MSEPTESVKRRTFLGKIAGGAIAGLAGLFGVLAVGFLYPVGRRKPQPVFVCFADDVPDEEPLPITDLAGRTVFLLRGSDKNLIAITTVCTHLGCAVFYRSAERVFDCPCHQGKFDAQGNPIAGPPLTPLERYPVEVREGKVFVQFS